jgi:hypothetical protein
MTRQPGFLPGHAPLLLITSALLALGCGDDPAAPVTFLLGSGQEIDALNQPPVPIEVTLLGVKDGSASALLRSALPAERLVLDALSSEGTWTFRAELRDAAGTLLLRGQTPPLSSGLLAGSTVPIHCGRVSAFSRPSAGLSAGWTRPALALALDRYLLVAGESVEEGTPTELYDLAALLPLVASAPLPRAPRTTAASRSGWVLLINDKGATTLDLSTGAVVEITAELAGDASGGQVIDDGDGGSFVGGRHPRRGGAHRDGAPPGLARDAGPAGAPAAEAGRGGRVGRGRRAGGRGGRRGGLRRGAPAGVLHLRSHGAAAAGGDRGCAGTALPRRSSSCWAASPRIRPQRPRGASPSPARRGALRRLPCPSPSRPRRAAATRSARARRSRWARALPGWWRCWSRPPRTDPNSPKSRSVHRAGRRRRCGSRMAAWWCSAAWTIRGRRCAPSSSSRRRDGLGARKT